MFRYALLAAIAVCSTPAFAFLTATYPTYSPPDKGHRNIEFSNAVEVWGFNNSFTVNPIPSPYIQNDLVCVLFAGGYSANQHYELGSHSLTITRLGTPYNTGGDVSVTIGGTVIPMTPGTNYTIGGSVDVFWTVGTAGGNFCFSATHT